MVCPQGACSPWKEEGRVQMERPEKRTDTMVIRFNVRQGDIWLRGQEWFPGFLVVSKWSWRRTPAGWESFSRWRLDGSGQRGQRQGQMHLRMLSKCGDAWEMRLGKEGMATLCIESLSSSSF